AHPPLQDDGQQDRRGGADLDRRGPVAADGAAADLAGTLSIDPQRDDEEASGGPSRPAALVGLASTHACRLNRPSRDRTCFDKRCRPCRPVFGPETWWTGGRGHGGHLLMGSLLLLFLYF